MNTGMPVFVCQANLLNVKFAHVDGSSKEICQSFVKGWFPEPLHIFWSFYPPEPCDLAVSGNFSAFRSTLAL